MHHLRRVALLAALPASLVLVGAAGYVLIEGWPLFDAVYMAVITLTTVGFSETHPLSRAGRIFTMGFAAVGVSFMFYAGAEIVRLVISGELRTALGRQRMQTALAKLSGHYIVCGYGRMGRLICDEFAKAGSKFVVIEREASRVEDFQQRDGHFALQGDATSDATLRAAGIERAAALVTAVASDADSLFITMSARLLSEKLFIVARADGEGALAKLQRAGASRVVSPYLIGGAHVAQAVLRPNVVDFVELATKSEHIEIQIEEVLVEEGSQLSDKTIREAALRDELDVIIVAIKDANGHMVYNPRGDARIRAGDTLIMLGKAEGLVHVERRAAKG